MDDGNEGNELTIFKPDTDQLGFIRRYTQALESGDVALFAGAGISRAAGFVDWRELLKDIATDLGLDINRESDLIAVAQYHVNEKKNRARINQVLVDELTKSAVNTPNHSILARLNIQTVWTTNYDQLLERAFEDAGKVVDVKITQENLAHTRRDRNTVLYKMHGCVTHPSEAIVTKDDYEQYERKKPLFVESLKGDLISKTFLFLGFSFTDPNIDYILSRVRAILGANQREHFCIMRRPQKLGRLLGKAKAEFEYEQRKIELRHADLQRFGIETIWVDDFSHIEALLMSLSAFAHRNSIFISGAAKVHNPLGSPRLEALAKELGTQIIGNGYRLVSGFGFGLGEQSVLGALGSLYAATKGTEADRVLVRPFPRSPKKSDQSTYNTRHREDLISRAGSIIVLAGNKDDGSGGVVDSTGVFEEVEIARRLGKFIIPIGATGHVALKVWEQAVKNQNDYLPGLRVNKQLKILGNAKASNEQLLKATFSILSAIEKFVTRK